MFICDFSFIAIERMKSKKNGTRGTNASGKIFSFLFCDFLFIPLKFFYIHYKVKTFSYWRKRLKKSQMVAHIPKVLRKLMQILTIFLLMPFCSYIENIITSFYKIRRWIENLLCHHKNRHKSHLGESLDGKFLENWDSFLAYAILHTQRKSFKYRIRN